jgi:hypothetical protein
MGLIIVFSELSFISMLLVSSNSFCRHQGLRNKPLHMYFKHTIYFWQDNFNNFVCFTFQHNNASISSISDFKKISFVNIGSLSLSVKFEEDPISGC